MCRAVAKILVTLIFVSQCLAEVVLQNSTGNEGGKSSLVFVFDTTGSMHNDLKQLREGAEMILDTALNESSIIADFVFVPFHDPAVGPATVTRDKKEFQEALNIVRVYGGGDCPEKSLSGIQLALNVSRPKSFIYVFTDATASDHRFVGKVLDSVQRKQSQVVFVLTGHCNDLDRPTFKVYQQIAAASSGQVFNLNKASVHKVLEFVRSSIKARSVNLGSMVNPAGYNFTREIPIDSTLGEVTVSVSGLKPQIKVVNPSGEELTGPPKLVKTLDLSEIMVVKVLQPEPGNWSITVGSEEDYSVKVVGLSNLTFDHGFSVEKPASMAETSYRPLRGTYNNMMIKLTKADVPVHLSYAQILNLNGNTLFEVPLKEVDGENKVYLADAFMPPDEFFYIAINGRDQNNQELRRAGTTAVQAKLPDVPYLTALRKMEVRPHERVVLICNVESLVPVTSLWTRNSVGIQPKTSSLQTTSIEYAIEDMSEEHVGTYVCSAKNVAGQSKTDTELVLLVDPPIVTIEPLNATFELEEDLTISCTIVSEALLLKYEIYFNGVNMNIGGDSHLEPNLEGVYKIDKTIKSLNENNTGLYSCIATNRGGQTNQSTYVQVKSQPIIHILGSHTLTELKYTDIQIECEVENTDTVRWVAPNNTIVKEYILRNNETKYKDVLTLKNVTSGGVWECMAVRGSFSDSDSVEITIVMKPKVTMLGDKQITVVNGTSYILVCLVESIPIPKILWHRGTEEFLKHSVTLLKPDFYKSVLTLNSSKENVEGTYFCIGENYQGLDQNSISVSVLRKMTLVNGFTDLSVELYYQVELQCEVDSYPPPRVHWYHNGTELQVNHNLHLSDDNTTVYIKKVEFDNLGLYMCEAENGFESLRVNGTLSVHGLQSPTILKESSRHVARKGQPTMITCSVKGNPEPSITWNYRNNTSDDFAALPRGVTVNENEELSISNVGIEHSGNYRCTADNVLGRDHLDTELVVNYPPELSLEGDLDDDIPREVAVGGKVELSCKAVGSPPPMVTWTKNGHPVVYTNNLHLTDTNALVVKNATAKDAGVFTCMATSALGTSERNFTLVVYMAPEIKTANVKPKQEVLEGQLVEMPCSVQGVPTPIVTWKKDGNIIEERRKYIDEFGLRFVANLSDIGNYSCTAGNERGIMTLNYTLSVWVAPSIEPFESSKKVLVGTNTTILCKATGFPTPTVVWEFQDEQLKENTTHVSFNDHGMLFLKNASSDLEGNYTCVATNTAGVARQSTRIIINDPPELSLEGDSDDDVPREVAVGGKVEFSCKAVGSPPPMVTWTKNGHPVVYTNNLHLTDANALVVENATAKDAGVFTCKAISALGSSERNFTLVIFMRPNISTPNIEPQQEVLEGQLVELPCSVQGLPTPIVTWKQDGNIIDERRKYIDEFGLRFVANLSDFGNYSCTAGNEYGMMSLTYTLSVWVPPYIEALPSSVEVITGTNMKIECNVIGFPIPSIVWEFQEELLTENSSHVSFNDQGALFINNASFEQEGIYSCVAENNAGVASQSTRVVINEPPKILSDNYTGTYLATNMDTAVTIACRATGKPKPYVVWFKDDYYLDRDSRYNIDVDGSLTINSPTEDQSGNYTCIAKNSVGKVNRSVTVDIYSLPTTMQSDESHTSLSVVEGSNMSIQCPAQATHSVSINWYKDAKLISQNHLTLLNVSRNDASTYACVVKNAIGSAYATIQLKVEWPPIFLVNESQDIEVVRGDDRYLDCGVDAKPAAKTRWLFNSKPILFEDKVRLKLMNIQLHNAGTYKCIVSNSHGTVVKQFTLDVLEPPFISEFDLLDVQLEEGSNPTLECNARGSPEPNITWTFHIENWYIQNSTLIAAKITSKSEGLFRCDAHNKAGSAHIVYRVAVVSGAKIAEVVAFSDGEGVSVDNSIEAVVGTHLRISCKATGAPTPIVQWIRKGNPLSRNTRNIDYADLVFADVQRLNAGVYSCVTSNEGGSDKRTVKIEVLEPPKIYQNLFDTPKNDNVINLEVISGQAFYLHCHPYGNPIPEVYWFRDEMPLKLFDDTMVSSEFGEVLTVRSAVFEQSGNYTCVARNNVGNSSIVYLVDVLVPPPILKDSSKRVSSRMGIPLNLTCPERGSPIPYAMWIKHPYTEISEDTPRVQLLNDNYTLIINDTEISDSGRYTCILTNKVGTTEYTFNVTIRKPPTIAGNVPGNNFETHVVPLRRSIVLKCETDGNPMPIISWLKDTQQLSDSLPNIQRVLGNSMLAIRSMSERDAGQYICVVENEAGSAHRRYNVAVQVPGKWGPWSQWSTCNVTCGVGSQHKHRSCYYIDDNNNTIDKTSESERIVIDEFGCGGLSSEIKKCQMPKCEDKSQSHWSAWSKWSPCSASCGVATQSRTRRCKSKTLCTEDNVQIRKCPDLPKCSIHDPSGNDVYSSTESNETDTYLPEVTFEMEPEVPNRQPTSDVDVFSIHNVLKKPTVYFDVNVTENLDQSDRGPCDFGFRHNVTESSCDDIDECLIEVNQCHSTQVCVNTEGAYKCTCQPGYVSLGAGQRCLDVNECSQELHGCQFACVNVAGGYVCACPRRLRLHADRHHCVSPSSYRNTYVTSYEDLDPEVYLSKRQYPVKYTEN